MTRLLAPCVLGMLLISGCATQQQTPYRRPDVVVPAHWQSPTTGGQLASGTRWWTQFGDPQLNALIDTVLRNNNDLAVAALVLRRARLQAGVAENQMAPTLGGGGDANFSKALRPTSSTAQNYNASLTPSYELDLWGQLASQRDETSWEVNATEWDRLASALGLIGTTAQLYWQLSYLDQQIAATQHSVQDAEHLVALLQTRPADDASRLEAAQAAQALATRQAEVSAWQQQRAAAQYALAILANQPPESALPTPSPLAQQSIPDIPAGVPAKVLARRPDLQAAEWRLRESLAHVDSTRLSIYPTFTLTGHLSGSSSGLLDVLTHPVATLGLGVTLPFLHWRSNQLNIDTAQTDYEIAALRFRQTLYQALADVETVLSARHYDQEQGVALQQAADHAQVAEAEAERRYLAGKGTLKEWLDQQDARRNNDSAVANNRYRQLNDTMAVYRSIGGDPTSPPPSVAE